MEANHIKVEKTAHFYTMAQPGPNIDRIIFAFHGYGQAARNFVHKFDGLDDGKTWVICPEGLHRFYWKGFTGDVVASWMTKQDRELDIEDNMNYLNQLFRHVTSQVQKNVKITVLGFSQGCPTASRWVSSQQPNIHHMILWAGQLAHDEDYSKSKDYFSDKKLLFVYGNDDEFLPYGYKERQLSLAKLAHMEFDVIPFEGKHEINRDILKKIFVDLESVQKLF